MWWWTVDEDGLGGIGTGYREVGGYGWVVVLCDIVSAVFCFLLFCCGCGLIVV